MDALTNTLSLTHHAGLYGLPLYAFLSRAGQLAQTGRDVVHNANLPICSELLWPQLRAPPRDTPHSSSPIDETAANLFGTVKAAEWVNNALPHRWFAVGERALGMVRFGRIYTPARQRQEQPPQHTAAKDGGAVVVALEVAVVLTTQPAYDAFTEDGIRSTPKTLLLDACLADVDATDCALVTEGFPTGGVRLTFRRKHTTGEAAWKGLQGKEATEGSPRRATAFALDMVPVLAPAIPAAGQTALDGATVRNKLVFHQEGHVPFSSVFPLQLGHHGMAPPPGLGMSTTTTIGTPRVSTHTPPTSIWVPARPLEVYSSMVASIGVGKKAAAAWPSAAVLTGRGCAGLAYPPSLIPTRSLYHTPYFPVKEAEGEFVRCARRLHAQGFASFAPECFAVNPAAGRRQTRQPPAEGQR